MTDDDQTAARGDDAEDRPARADDRAARADDHARTIAYLDLAEGRGPVPVLDDEGIAELLRATRRIAVIGASSNAGRPSFRSLINITDPTRHSLISFSVFGL
jgi:hypothetical protein